MTLRPLLLAVLAVPLAAGAAQAQGVNLTIPLGSTGADGPLLVEFNTSVQITLPPDGVLNYTTVTIQQGATVTFERNALNTPVYLMATGDIAVAQGATISVDADPPSGRLGGRGGPGGFDGADRPAPDQLEGRGGFGPGGGKPVAKGHWPGAGTYTYGNQYLMPLIGGSGGAASTGDSSDGYTVSGGGGGGAILIASNTRIQHLGSVTASGSRPLSYTSDASGSGGAVRLLAPVVEGNGTIAGAAHARVDALDTGNLAISPVNWVGDLMQAFLDAPPRLEVLGIDDQSVPQNDDGATVFVTFPLDSGTVRPVLLRASNLQGLVSITIRLTPEQGQVIEHDVIMDMDTYATSPGVAEHAFDMDFPANRRTFVEAWTNP